MPARKRQRLESANAKLASVRPPAPLERELHLRRLVGVDILREHLKFAEYATRPPAAVPFVVRDND